MFRAIRLIKINLITSIVINTIQIIILINRQQQYMLNIILILICLRLINIQINKLNLIVSYIIVVSSFFSIMDIFIGFDFITGIICTLIVFLIIIFGVYANRRC